MQVVFCPPYTQGRDGPVFERFGFFWATDRPMVEKRVTSTERSEPSLTRQKGIRDWSQPSGSKKIPKVGCFLPKNWVLRAYQASK